METTKMTIHRALAELKLLDARINKQTTEIFPIGFHQKGKLIDGRFEKEKFETDVTSSYQSIIDLIARKNNIKCAIVKSNANTTVIVAGKTMTVAEAINYKALVSYKKNLMIALKQKQNQVLAVYNRNMELVNANAQKLLEAALGKDNVKGAEANQVENITKPFLSLNEFHLVDPLKI